MLPLNGKSLLSHKLAMVSLIEQIKELLNAHPEIKNKPSYKRWNVLNEGEILEYDSKKFIKGLIREELKLLKRFVKVIRNNNRRCSKNNQRFIGEPPLIDQFNAAEGLVMLSAPTGAGGSKILLGDQRYFDSDSLIEGYIEGRVTIPFYLDLFPSGCH